MPVRVGDFCQKLAHLKLEKKYKNDGGQIERTVDQLNETASF